MEGNEPPPNRREPASRAHAFHTDASPPRTYVPSEPGLGSDTRTNVPTSEASNASFLLLQATAQVSKLRNLLNRQQADSAVAQERALNELRSKLEAEHERALKDCESRLKTEYDAAREEFETQLQAEYNATLKQLQSEVDSALHAFEQDREQ